jgi:hypothetical protein
MLLRESVKYLLENASCEDLELLRDYMENAKVLREAEEYFNEAYCLTEETLVEEFSDGQLAVILEDNGYAVTAENIYALREDIETGAVVIGPEVPDAKGGKDADEEDFDIDNGDIDEYTETETAEDLKAAIVESYLDLMD